MMTLFSADEKNHETITGSAAFSAAKISIGMKRSDPEVTKTLRMFRKCNKKFSLMNQKTTNGVSSVKIKKEYNNTDENSANNAMPKKFAPMLSTINLSPKIALRRVDEVDKHLLCSKGKVSAIDLSNELRHIQKTMPFSPSKNSMSGFSKQKVNNKFTLTMSMWFFLKQSNSDYLNSTVEAKEQIIQVGFARFSYCPRNALHGVLRSAANTTDSARSSVDT